MKRKILGRYKNQAHAIKLLQKLKSEGKTDMDLIALDKIRTLWIVSIVIK